MFAFQMGYLIQNDFRKVIQTESLNQLTGSDPQILIESQLYGQAMAKSHLVQKYDVAKEFTDTLKWSYSIAYKARQRVYLDAAPYNPALTYTLNTIILQTGSVYICTTVITVPEAFTISKWAVLGLQYALFYVTPPKPEFNLYQVYFRNDQVLWNDKTYTAIVSTSIPGHDAMLQAGTYRSAEATNVYPDDITQGRNYWGIGVAYSIAAGTLPTDSTKWTSGDNRCPELVIHCVNIALYLLHSRISSNNIPEHRVKNYDESIAWLKDAAKGDDITADIPVLQPKAGARIRFGGNIKNINSY